MGVIYSLPSCIDALVDIYLMIASFDVRRKRMLNVIKFLIQYKKDLKGLQSPYKFQNWRVFSGRGPSRNVSIQISEAKSLFKLHRKCVSSYNNLQIYKIY